MLVVVALNLYVARLVQCNTNQQKTKVLHCTFRYIILCIISEA